MKSDVCNVENMRPPQEFADACMQDGLEVNSGQLDLLARYLQFMLKANRQFNLTSIRDWDEAWLKHIHDSLILLPFLEGISSLMDLGSGGGLPGIPLAVMNPSLKVTLVEATKKKAKFLQEAVNELNLSNTQVVCERSETIGQAVAHRARYDAVTARAVGSVSELIELSMPLLKIKGVLLAIKGPRAEQDIAAADRALQLLHAEVVSVKKASTCEDNHSFIVRVKKSGATPKAYPRLPGMPKKMPL